MSTAYEPRPYPGSWKEHRDKIRHGIMVPFHFLEWLTRLTAYYLSRWSLLEVLEYAGRFTVLVAVIVYFSEAPDRKKQKHYQAWQVINSAAGKSGNGGRLEALEELNEDKVSLVGIDLSKAFLQGVRLPNADLHFATMQGCDLRECDLRRADLEGTDLSSSNLRNGNLQDVDARGADLFGTDLTDADLAGADLSRADLRNADLANLRWQKITRIELANIQGIEHAPDGFVAWATQHGAVSIADDDTWDTMKSANSAATKP